LQRPIIIDKRDVRVGASIGIAIYPDNSNSADKLLQQAEDAMYEEKRNRSGGWQLSSAANRND